MRFAEGVAVHEGSLEGVGSEEVDGETEELTKLLPAAVTLPFEDREAELDALAELLAELVGLPAAVTLPFED